MFRAGNYIYIKERENKRKRKKKCFRAQKWVLNISLLSTIHGFDMSVCSINFQAKRAALELLPCYYLGFSYTPRIVSDTFDLSYIVPKTPIELQIKSATMWTRIMLRIFVSIKLLDFFSQQLFSILNILFTDAIFCCGTFVHCLHIQNYRRKCQTGSHHSIISHQWRLYLIHLMVDTCWCLFI